MGTLASGLRAIAPLRDPVPRVYVDANVPARLVSMMRGELRWDVRFVLEDPALRRATDRQHFVFAAEDNRTLITLDQDFADDAVFPPALSPGLIVCSAPGEPMLRRMLVHVDRQVFRRDGAGEQPLKGRKLLLTPEAVTGAPAAPGRRRRRPRRAGG